MKNDILGKIFFGILGLIALGMIGMVIYEINDRHTNYETHFETITHVIINKESEKESINNFGNFRTNYYLLLDDGKLKNVELKEYMSLNIGDTISWTESYEVRKVHKK